MIEPKVFFNTLIGNGVEFFSGVPDSLLKAICFYIADNTTKENHVIAANEGNALSLGVGYHLSTSKVPLIYLQNSGIGNIINPLLSIADTDVYSIPLLLMIGWRGEPNVEDEPQHKKQGKVTIKLLETMEIPYTILSKNTDNEEVVSIIRNSILKAKKYSMPYALVVKKGTFSDYKLKNNYNKKFPLKREDAIKLIIDNFDSNDIIVSTTGVTSRELFEYRSYLGQEHKQDFLTVGGMGHASQIALGIAMQKPHITVFCLDGDGAALMHLGSLPINASSSCKNFIHIVFNNGAHDSVGGQPTVGYKIDFPKIAEASGYDIVLCATTKIEVKKSLALLKRNQGVNFLEIRVEKGFRSNLSRPSKSPLDNKESFMNFIKYSASE
jgi:phosphonopyruvate decarboxylase